MQIPWKCAYCDRSQIASEMNFSSDFHSLRVGTTDHGSVGLEVIAVRCVNAECAKLTMNSALWRSAFSRHEGTVKSGTDAIARWRMLPRSGARVFPDLIPEALRQDYEEACLIRDLSPKASATLSRRCLQGMIRDFANISKATLYAEIDELKKQVEAGSGPRGVQFETIDALHAVRSIGNIGAHMEKDINVIVDVDPNEAQSLINLIEMLFQDWYIARHERQSRLEQVLAVADDKKALRNGTVLSLPEPE